MDNVRIVLLDMPGKIRGYTIYKDDFYTIVINANLNQEMQRRAYHHEMYHINNGDFEKSNGTGLIELHAHHI